MLDMNEVCEILGELVREHSCQRYLYFAYLGAHQKYRKHALGQHGCYTLNVALLLYRLNNFQSIFR